MRLAAFLLLLGIFAFAAYYIFQIPVASDASTTSVFYWIRIWVIPVPIPIGLFKTPHFWGWLSGVFAFGFALAALAELSRISRR